MQLKRSDIDIEQLQDNLPVAVPDEFTPILDSLGMTDHEIAAHLINLATCAKNEGVRHKSLVTILELKKKISHDRHATNSNQIAVFVQGEQDKVDSVINPKR